MPFVRQPDLFAAAGVPAALPVPSREQRPRLALNDMDDAASIAAIPGASLADCHALAAEAGRRRLAAAIPALEALCRRFRGSGSTTPCRSNSTHSPRSSQSLRATRRPPWS